MSKSVLQVQFRTESRSCVQWRRPKGPRRETYPFPVCYSLTNIVLSTTDEVGTPKTKGGKRKKATDDDANELPAPKKGKKGKKGKDTTSEEENGVVKEEEDGDLI